VVAADRAAPTGPEDALRMWKSSRQVKPIRLDDRKRTVSILFLCDNCWRAIYAEKQLARQADTLGVGDRLLVLSAGFDAQPGAKVPEEIIEEAARRSIDLSEEKPCAAFNLLEDLESYDYIICLDRRIRERMLSRAETVARQYRVDYTEWESKVRLMRDITGDKSLTKSAWELDISKFNTSDNETVMNDIESACAELLNAFRDRGL